MNKAHDESDDDDDDHDDDDDDSHQDENFESGIFICIISLFKDSFYAWKYKDVDSKASDSDNVRHQIVKDAIISLPLSERLRLLRESKNNVLEHKSKSLHRKLVKERITNQHIGRLNKNAPAEMASNRPVRR